MKINRFLPLIIPLISIVLSEIYYNWPRSIFVILVLAVLSFIFTVRQFTRVSTERESSWNYIILPSIFYLSSITFSTLIPYTFVVKLLFVINAVFLYLYFYSIYSHLVHKVQKKKYSLENLSSYGNFLAFYFSAASVYGFQSFLNIEVWKLLILLLVIIALIIYQVIWANKINRQIGLFYLLLLSIVLSEVAWSISFLPLNFYILGLILAVLYYILIGIVRFHLTKELNRKIVKLYLIFGFGSIIMVLFTARWL